MREPVGLRDFQRIFAALIEPRTAPDPTEGAPKARRKRARRATLAGALKEAAKAGRAVASAQIYGDSVRLDFGEPATSILGEAINTPEELRRLI